MYAILHVVVICHRAKCEKPEFLTAIIVPVEQVQALTTYSAVALPHRTVVLGNVVQVLPGDSSVSEVQL